MRRLLKKLQRRSDGEEGQAKSLSTCSTSSSDSIQSERFGLFPLHEPSSPGADGHTKRKFPVNIIAVHGLIGDAYTTWTHPNGTLWLRDLLPTYLPGCRVYTFGYPSQVVFNSSSADMGVCAQQLLNSVRELLEALPEEEGRDIIFVCHGFGGIIFKQVSCWSFSSMRPLLMLLRPGTC
jgi:hypothetical protein